MKKINVLFFVTFIVTAIVFVQSGYTIQIAQPIINSTSLNPRGEGADSTDEAATSSAINLSNAAGPVSLILYGTNSTDVDVTYQIGYTRIGNTATTWITPADGGVVDDLTTVSFSNTASHHGSFNLPSGDEFRFIITNNDTGNAATGVELYLRATELNYN